MKEISTKKYEKLIEKIYVDDREKSRIPYAKEQYANLNPIVAHLNNSDYLFKGYNNIYVAFEYKTGRDFLNSIANNHLHNQTYSLIQEVAYHFIIVEVYNLEQLVKSYFYESGVDITMEQVNGAITTFNSVSTVIFAQTRKQAFDMMLRQAGKIIQQKPFKYQFTRKTTNSALNYLSAIKGVNDKADLICKELELRTHKDLMELNEEKLCSVKTIGEKTAKKIMKELHG